VAKNAVAEYVPLQGVELLDRVAELVRGIGERFFELGQHLYEIKHTETYKEKEYGSWVDYCDAELPFQYRKADHYIELWELFSQKLGISWAEVEHVGWSKLIKVKGLIENKKDAKKWIKVCEQFGRRELETLVKDEHDRSRGEEPGRPPVEFVEHDTDLELEGLHGEGAEGPFIDPSILTHSEISLEDPETGEAVPLHQFQVYLYAEQWKNVMSAMERAAQLTNSDKACFLLDMMATEFNSTFVEAGDGGVAQNLNTIVKNLERVFDVSIEVSVRDDSKLLEMSRLDEASKKKAKKAKKAKKKAKKAKKKVRTPQPPKEKKAKKGKEQPQFRW
jgi:hypothetical protein